MGDRHPPFLTSDMLGAAPHGFFGRGGGASDGIFAGLNVGLGSDDDRDAVMENRQRVVDSLLPGAKLATLYQVHSAKVVTLTEAPGFDERPEADAMVTDRPGLLLGILTADCVPVLFHDPKANVVGAAHSGWKGAIGGVNEATLAAMDALGASRDTICAVVGPCIAQASYEVDEGFRDRFIADDAANAAFFAAGSPGHHQFDLEGYVGARLRAAGLGQVTLLGVDTYANEADYFSFRRATHRSEPDYGRQISVIGLAR